MRVVIGSSIFAIGPVSLKPNIFRPVPAPATPDIVARYDKASATDANECSHLKKRACRRSLNLGTSENGNEAKDIARPQNNILISSIY